MTRGPQGRLIVIEGPDNAGKSTLVERLRKDSKHRFVSMLGGRTMDHVEMRRQTYKLTNEIANGFETRTVLCERFFPLSDSVYRRLYGGERAFSPNEYKSVLHDLRGKIRIVYCRPPLSFAMQAALTGKGDDDAEWIEKVQQTLPALYSAYDEIMARLSWFDCVPVVRYDFSDPAQAQLVEAFACAG